MKKQKLFLRLPALLLALSLLFSACVYLPTPTMPATEAPTVPATTTPAVTEKPTAPETTLPEPATTAAPATTEEPVDPEDEALIRWQNGGQKDFLPDEKVELVPFSEMEYLRPDTEALYADFDALIERAKDSDDADALLEEYYELYQRYISFYSMDTLANIRHSTDTTDSWYKAEYDFCEEQTPTVEEKREALMKAFAASPSRKALEKAYFGQDFFDYYDDYEVYTNPEYLRLSQEENAILSQYRDLTSDQKVTYKGETKSLDEFLEEAEDVDSYYGALEAYYDQYNESLGELYVQLVKIRQQLASVLDYESYADYSYEMTYTRDYSPEEGDVFLAGIREYLVPVMKAADNSAALSWLDSGSATEKKVMDYLESAAKNIGGSVWDAYRFMRAYELCDIAKSSVKVEASFQTYIYDYEAPYVLVNATGTGDDYSTFSHEFGHFTDAYHNYGANEDLETAETFSQAMEFLALNYNGVIDEKQQNKLVKLKLLDCLQTFVYQGAFADFEARVYALDPEEISVEKINSIFLQCMKDYGLYESGKDYYKKGFDFYYSKYWVDVIHFFEVPYYIISYCVSAETSLQVYRLEEAEKGAGVAAYFRLLDRDYEAGIQQVMEDAELENPFREEVLEQTAAFFKEKLGLK